MNKYHSGHLSWVPNVKYCGSFQWMFFFVHFDFKNILSNTRPQVLLSCQQMHLCTINAPQDKWALKNCRLIDDGFIFCINGAWEIEGVWECEALCWHCSNRGLSNRQGAGFARYGCSNNANTLTWVGDTQLRLRLLQLCTFSLGWTQAGGGLEGTVRSAKFPIKYTVLV